MYVRKITAPNLPAVAVSRPVPTTPSAILVRHGETEWSATGRHTSSTDVALTARGRRQAGELRDVLAGVEAAEVLTSPLQRASESCRLAGFGERAVVEPDLREWEYGDYEGLTTPEIRDRAPGWSVFTAGCPGGENAFEVEQRADRLVARLRASQGIVLCFGHGHMLRVLAARWLGLGAVDGRRLALDPASVSVLGDERGVPALLTWNSGPRRW